MNAGNSLLAVSTYGNSIDANRTLDITKPAHRTMAMNPTVCRAQEAHGRCGRIVVDPVLIGSVSRRAVNALTRCERWRADAAASREFRRETAAMALAAQFSGAGSCDRT